VQQVPDVEFYILGQGPLTDQLKADVVRRRLEDQVTVGYVPDPSAVVNRSLVHLSIESFDNATNQSLLEGMAAGCAVVATDTGATRTVVTDDAGVLTTLDPGEIAKAIVSLLAQPDLAARLGAAGRCKILAEHHVDGYITYLRGVHDFGEIRAFSAPAVERMIDVSAARPGS